MQPFAESFVTASHIILDLQASEQYKQCSRTFLEHIPLSRKYPQKALHNWPVRARYGVYFVNS